METKERTAKWILWGMIFFAIACSMFLSFAMRYIPGNNKKEPAQYCIGYPPVSFDYEPLYFIAKSSGPPTWIYYIWIHERNYHAPIKSGATLSICGDAIVSASVTGEALLDEFGAWRVKKTENHYVTFEATKDAIIRRSFEGFSITAPKSTAQTTINWIFSSPDPSLNQYFGKDAGWGTQGTAWGPGK
jgi:hypothetical protein